MEKNKIIIIIIYALLTVYQQFNGTTLADSIIKPAL